MRKQFDSTTFPPPRHVPVLRYAVDGDMAPVALDDDDDDDPVDDNHADDDGLGIDGGSCDAQVEAVRRELRLGLVVSQASSSPVTMAVDEASPHDNNMEEHAAGTRHRAAAAASTWNETIQSFDALPNDQRCLVREKSKQCGPSLKDNPFEANLLLENMIQAERSRRLTQRTVDVLSRPSAGRQLLPTSQSDSRLTRRLYGDDVAADHLVEKLNAEHTRDIVERNFKVTESFCKHEFHVGHVAIAPDFRDVVEAEHNQLKMTTAKWIGRMGGKFEPSLVDTIDLGLSRVRNENAVESVVKSLNPKHEKRLIQALIDSDQQVVEEEVRRQKIQEHKQRMEKIAHRGREEAMVVEAPRTVSAWQRRNVLAAAVKEGSIVPPPTSSRAKTTTKETAPEGGGGRRPRVIRPYMTIETVEDAQHDALPDVTTKELLLRCARIRKQSRESLRDLARAKYDFVESELQWETTRRDPIELLR
ncbi:hypothetical protein As57867_007064, partial [Aphanomyces stellatus]